MDFGELTATLPDFSTVWGVLFWFCALVGVGYLLSLFLRDGRSFLFALLWVGGFGFAWKAKGR